MIRAVIFDFNGVLVDDEHLHFELLRDLLAGQGITLSERDYWDVYLGYDDRRCFEEALRVHGRLKDSAQVDALMHRKAALYLERARDGLRFFPGSARCVQELSERWPVAINSGALRAEIELALGVLGIRRCVGPIISAEDTECCKPDPEGYLLTLDALRAAHGEDMEAGHCLVVEDSLAGVQSGKAAGMWVVGVTNSYDADALRGAGADAVVGDLDELSVAAVQRLFQPEIWP